MFAGFLALAGDDQYDRELMMGLGEPDVQLQRPPEMFLGACGVTFLLRDHPEHQLAVWIVRREAGSCPDEQRGTRVAQIHDGRIRRPRRRDKPAGQAFFTQQWRMSYGLTSCAVGPVTK